jgi:hypothetical protein
MRLVNARCSRQLWREPRCNSAVPAIQREDDCTNDHHANPNARPPFWPHRYFYLALKIIVLALCTYLWNT